MKLPKVLILQLVFLGLASRGSVVAYGLLGSCTCELVSPQICRSEYNWTIFPNEVNKFGLQKDAMIGFNSFPVESLARQNCSSMLINFLCSYYFPPCLNSKELNCQGVGPCDTLCKEVRSGCEPLLLKYNLTWPRHLKCNKFPKPKSGVHCIPAIRHKATTEEVKPDSPCEKIQQPICASLHKKYMTQFPNKDLITQREAEIQFNTFLPALQSNCSSAQKLKVLLCTSHYPVCTDGSFQIRPCKHVCQEVKDSCEPFLMKRNISWPKFLNCSNFLNKSDGLCADSDFIAPSTASPKVTTISKQNNDTCEPILPEVLKICGGIHTNYTLTHFPHGRFTSQRQAIEAIKNSAKYSTYLRLIGRNCAAELKPFLCLNFFPMCIPTQPITIVKPCRNICRKAQKGCEPCLKKKKDWNFDCTKYHVKGTCLNLEKLKSYLRRSPKNKKC